jgi:MerR family mercuric resistance operon transcriptional regulator
MARIAGPSVARMTIGRLSTRTGCHLETVRYYERIGLLPKPGRTAGGHRLYGADAVSRVAFIRRARELGFTLEQVRNLLRLVDGGHYTCAQIRPLAVEHLDEIGRKIADLQSIERALRDMAARCVRGRAPRCAVIDALYEEGHIVARSHMPRELRRRHASPTASA